MCVYSKVIRGRWEIPYTTSSVARSARSVEEPDWERVLDTDSDSQPDSSSKFT